MALLSFFSNNSVSAVVALFIRRCSYSLVDVGLSGMTLGPRGCDRVQALEGGKLSEEFPQVAIFVEGSFFRIGKVCVPAKLLVLYL